MIVIPEQKYLLLSFFSQVNLKYFLKMLPSTISGLPLWLKVIILGIGAVRNL